MKLKGVEDYNKLKNDFLNKFQLFLKEDSDLNCFFYDLFVYGTAYIVGGFIRDILVNKPSRDVDVIVSLSYDKIIHLIKSYNLQYNTNRFDGIKISLKNIEVDIWSISDSWAFKNNLVKLNDQDVIDSIAKGCFYNYDSLVINVHSLNLNIREFSHFIESGTLDIIQKNKEYQLLNPTIEANILRAFYIKKLYNIRYSDNCMNYLISRIGYLNDIYSSSINRLVETKKSYTKYDSTLDEKTIKEYVNECINYSKNPRLFL